MSFGGGARQQIPVPPPPVEYPPMPEFEPISIEMPEQAPFPEFPKPFDPSAGEAKARREEEIRQLRLVEQRRKGYGSTLLTGGTGDETTPQLNRPMLLGR